MTSVPLPILNTTGYLLKRAQTNTNYYDDYYTNYCDDTEQDDAEQDFHSFKKIGFLPVIKIKLYKHHTKSLDMQQTQNDSDEHNGDFNYNTHEQNPTNWRSLRPILFDISRKNLRQFGKQGAIYHFEEYYRKSAFAMYDITSKLIETCDFILKQTKLQKPEGHFYVKLDKNIDETYINKANKGKNLYIDLHQDKTFYIKKALYINLHQDTSCNCYVCCAAHYKPLNSKFLAVLKKILYISKTIKPLCKYIIFISLKENLPYLPNELIDHILKYCIKDLSPSIDCEVKFVDVRHKELFDELLHHLTAIYYRLVIDIAGVESNQEDFFYNSTQLESFNCLLCCNISNFVKTKIQSLPSIMRASCSDFGNNHQLLTGMDNFMIVNKCFILFMERWKHQLLKGMDNLKINNKYFFFIFYMDKWWSSLQTKNYEKKILHQEKYFLKIKNYNAKKIKRINKRIVDEKLWINAPIDLDSIYNFGNFRSRNNILRFMQQNNGQSFIL